MISRWGLELSDLQMSEGVPCSEGRLCLSYAIRPSVSCFQTLSILGADTAEGCWGPRSLAGGPYLLHDPVDLAVLCVNLVAHVQGHVTEVSNHATDLLQVFIHLAFPGVVCYPVGKEGAKVSESMS